MKQLKFYIKQIDPNLLKSISGRPGELIVLIKSGRFLNEEALAKALYGEHWNPQIFTNLKNRTKQILYAFFLISPPKKNKKTLKKIQDCRKNYLLGISLIEYAKREEATKHLIKALDMAEEYSLTKLAYDSALELMISAAIQRKKRTFNKYGTKVEKLEQDLIAERIIQQRYYEVAQRMGTSRGIQEDKLAQQIATLEKLSCHSAKFINYFYILCVLKDWQQGEYVAVKKSCRSAYQILCNKKGVYASTLHFFTQTQALASIALGEHQEAQRLLDLTEQYAPPKSYNQSVLQYYHAINALHSGDYQKAHDLYRNHRNQKSSPLEKQWTIMGAYLYFLHRLGYLEADYTRFSVGKYLNETVANAFDKTGSNVNILIGELLLYLVKDRNRLINRVESVNNYAYRHLKGKDTQRARWLIRLLCMIPRADFNFNRLQKIGTKQIANLKKHPIRSGDNLEIELIPFDKLLEMIHKVLDKKIAM